MTIDFPNHIVFWIVAMNGALGVAVWVAFSWSVKKQDFSTRAKVSWRWGLGVVIGGWFLARWLISIFPPGGKSLGAEAVIGFLAAGLVVGITALILSPTFRKTALSIPQAWVVGLHVLRVGGVLFLALADMKLLPNEFAVPAGYGDMVVGFLAIGVVYALIKRKKYARGLTILWNSLGLIDLFVALATGRIFIAGFVTQLAKAGTSVLYINYVLMIPSFAVGLLILLHTVSLLQMFRGPGERKSDAVK